MTDTEFAKKKEEFRKAEDELDRIANCNQHQGEKVNEKGENCDVCHHDKFTNEVETIKKIFGDNVTQCCSGHGYLFLDQCQVRRNYFF